MGVINTGMVPKAMMGGAGSEDPYQGAPMPLGRQPAPPRSSARLMAKVRDVAKLLAQHNDGGYAHHCGDRMAHPCGKL
jgi:hypothetical protein